VLRRLFWLVVGAALGAGSSLWAARRVTRSVRRLAPDHVARQAAAGARRGLTRVQGAVREGGEAMRAREAELRGALRGAGSPPA